MIRLLCLVLALAATPLRAEMVELVSPGGIRAWLAPDASIPMLALDIHFAGGTVLDPPGREGATRLMTGLLDEGAGDLDRIAFAERAEALGARIGFSAGPDGITVGATVLTEARDDSLELLRLALTAPRFDADAVALVRAQLLSRVRASDTDPGDRAGRAFAERAFPGHPYARPSDGTPDSVAALTRADAVAAHGRAFARDRVTVSAAGDITPEALGTLIDRLLGGLPATGPDLPAQAATADAAELHVIPMPGPQSRILAGHSGIARDDPAFLAAYVANHILGGGGFGSRLTEELRVRRGLVYGVGTGLSTGRYAPMVYASFSTGNGTAAEAVEVLRAEWARIAEAGVTAEELDAAKRYLTGAYPLQFDGNGRIASILTDIQTARLPLSYIEDRNARIAALTLAEVNAAAARVFRPGALRIVIAGAPDGLPAGEH